MNEWMLKRHHFKFKTNSLKMSARFYFVNVAKYYQMSNSKAFFIKINKNGFWEIPVSVGVWKDLRLNSWWCFCLMTYEIDTESTQYIKAYLGSTLSTVIFIWKNH